MPFADVLQSDRDRVLFSPDLGELTHAITYTFADTAEARAMTARVQAGEHLAVVVVANGEEIPQQITVLASTDATLGVDLSRVRIGRDKITWSGADYRVTGMPAKHPLAGEVKLVAIRIVELEKGQQAGRRS